MSRIGSDSQQYYQNWYIQIAGFPNGLVFINSRTEELSCARAPARKPRWLNPAPCTAAKGMYLVGARKQELPGATLLGNAVVPGRGTVVNMRGRFYGLVECLTYQTPNAAAGVASDANRPLPNATGGQKTPRRTRGFPMWAFLAINPRTGRNSRPYPRKFSSVRFKTKLTCRPRPA